MPIFLSQTYEIVTHESAEHGDIAESGFEWENVPYTFREVVELIHGGGFTNQQRSQGVPRWLTTDVIQDRGFLRTVNTVPCLYIRVRMHARSVTGRKLVVLLG